MMNEAPLNIPSAKWHTCVSTIKCDLIDEYVSLVVKNDWTSRCSWYKQYKEGGQDNRKKVKPDRKIRKKAELCQGPLCSYVQSYRDQLIKEEQKTISSTQTA
ncbi:MAG: hypothetical protein ACUVWO_01375 [Thermodesulfobacteriota bacterium]